MPGCDGSSVNFNDIGVATWSGSLVTGDPAPNQDNFVAILRLADNKWQIARKSTFENYATKPDVTDSAISSFQNLFPKYDDVARGDKEINNAINPANQAADALLLENASFTSSPFGVDQQTGKVVVSLSRKLTSPNVVFRLRADWIGIVIPSGQPKILSVTSNKFSSGETGVINIQVKNIGDAQGTFSAMLVNCEPFVQLDTSQTIMKTFQPLAADTIKINVSGGNLSEEMQKNCKVKVYEVNDPSIEDYADLTLALGKAKVCVPNKTFAEGNMIKRCNADGTAVELVETCEQGVTSDSQGNLICARPLEPTKPIETCRSDSDCPRYSACDSTTGKCFKCSDTHCCPSGKIWSDSKNSCVNPIEFVGIPNDTPCRLGWPNRQGNIVAINERNNACDLFEVTNAQLSTIAKEAAQCYTNGCETASCHVFCNQALKESGAKNRKDQTSFKKFAALYVIYGLGPAAKFMQNYFTPEICCISEESWGLCNNASWVKKCEPKNGFNSQVQRLQCKGIVGQPMGWASDEDMSQNSCIFSDLPAHVSINILQTGTCVDYSVALTTLLRLVGYKNNEVFSVSGPGHEYNLVKFPGETKWNLVDTVGNRPSPYNPGGTPGAWYPYCEYRLSSCANDNGQGSCPAKSEVFGC